MLVGLESVGVKDSNNTEQLESHGEAIRRSIYGLSDWQQGELARKISVGNAIPGSSLAAIFEACKALESSGNDLLSGYRGHPSRKQVGRVVDDAIVDVSTFLFRCSFFFKDTGYEWNRDEFLKSGHRFAESVFPESAQKRKRPKKPKSFVPQTVEAFDEYYRDDVWAAFNLQEMKRRNRSKIATLEKRKAPKGKRIEVDASMRELLRSYVESFVASDYDRFRSLHVDESKPTKAAFLSESDDVKGWKLSGIVGVTGELLDENHLMLFVDAVEVEDADGFLHSESTNVEIRREGPEAPWKIVEYE